MRAREVAYLQMLAILSASRTPRGRKNLAEELRIGEGVVRTLLEGGKDLGHVIVLKGGVKISEQGEIFLRDALNLCGISGMFTVDEARKLLCGKRCVAHVVEGEVGDVLKTRDSLIRLGSCGVLIVESRGGNLLIPPIGEPLEHYDVALAEALKSRVRRDASVIVACGDTFADALTPLEWRCINILRVF
ncbi:DUF4443 domain-containing protein [Pyrobaculum aerophilum]|uniref:DUF4443 domain-containing protein n=1 Tax=Pyrobaculum aerophilum TaxID=13773 RepID=UPI0015F291DC|nr:MULTISPECIES: DUF4443 domain-containing protein [Pyrobaculum]MCX8136453.1 hypothetical protein [Pyrobaculum aerophilum]